ncbi:hypothetical protein LAC03_03800 [Levilactobacillus acidifarinae]|nr:hypothetical protein LAC03_03800 [Levilactobacillus acidifarinae]
MDVVAETTAVAGGITAITGTIVGGTITTITVTRRINGLKM